MKERRTKGVVESRSRKHAKSFGRCRFTSKMIANHKRLQKLSHGTEGFHCPLNHERLNPFLSIVQNSYIHYPVPLPHMMASILRPTTLRQACIYGQVRSAFRTQASNPTSISPFTTLSPQRGSITSRIARLRSRQLAPATSQAAKFQTSSRKDILPAEARTSYFVLTKALLLTLSYRGHTRHRYRNIQ